ncbi:MAG: sodium-dependent transporter, partial [Oxalobacter sp.]
DLLDFISSNLMMPIDAIAASLLVGWKIWPVFAKRLAGDKNPFWLRLIRPLCRYIAPAVIAIILFQSLK